MSFPLIFHWFCTMKHWFLLWNVVEYIKIRVPWLVTPTDDLKSPDWVNIPASQLISTATHFIRVQAFFSQCQGNQEASEASRITCVAYRRRQKRQKTQKNEEEPQPSTSLDADAQPATSQHISGSFLIHRRWGDRFIWCRRVWERCEIKGGGKKVPHSISKVLWYILPSMTKQVKNQALMLSSVWVDRELWQQHYLGGVKIVIHHLIILISSTKEDMWM